MTRDEMVKAREEAQALVAELEHLGDYDVNARFIRRTAKLQLQLVQHLLDRMRRPA